MTMKKRNLLTMTENLKCYKFVVLLAVIVMHTEAIQDSKTKSSFIKCMKNLSKTYLTSNRPLTMVLPESSTENTNDNILEYLLQRREMEQDPNVFDVITEQFNTDVIGTLVIATHDKIMKELSNKLPVRVSGVLIILPKKINSQSHINRLQHQLIELEKHSNWNSSARFVLVVPDMFEHNPPRDLVKKVLKELWTKKIANVIVIIAAYQNYTNETTLNVYSWVPYHSKSHCGGPVDKVILLDQWVSNDGGKFLKGNNLFPSKIPVDLHGCTLRISTFPYPPYVIPLSKTAQIKYSSDITFYEYGLEIQLIRLIAERTNFRITYLPVPDNKWFGTMALLNESKGADVGLGSFMVNEENLQYFECTVPYIKEIVGWFVPVEQHIPAWQSLIRPFSPMFWLLVFVSYMLSSLTLWCLANRTFNALPTFSTGNELSLYRNLSQSFMSAYSVILGESVAMKPRTWACRVFFVLWVVYTLQINTAYQSSLTGCLVNPGLEPPITTIEEMLDAGLKIRSYPGMLQFFKNSGDWRFDKIAALYEPCQDIDSCCHDVAYKRDSVVACGRLYMGYEAPAKYSYLGQLLVRSLAANIIEADIVILLQKGSILKPQFDRLIAGVLQGGLMSKWWKDIKDAGSIKLKSHEKDLDDEDGDGRKELSLEHLQSAFGVWFLGLFMAFAAFVAELVYHRFSRRTSVVSVHGQQSPVATEEVLSLIQAWTLRMEYFQKRYHSRNAQGITSASTIKQRRTRRVQNMLFNGTEIKSEKKQK